MSVCGNSFENYVTKWSMFYDAYLMPVFCVVVYRHLKI